MLISNQYKLVLMGIGVTGSRRARSYLYCALSSIIFTLSMLCSTVISSMMNIGADLSSRPWSAISFCAVDVWWFSQVTRVSPSSRFLACTHFGHCFMVMATTFMFLTLVFLCGLVVRGI